MYILLSFLENRLWVWLLAYVQQTCCVWCLIQKDMFTICFLIRLRFPFPLCLLFCEPLFWKISPFYMLRTMSLDFHYDILFNSNHLALYHKVHRLVFYQVWKVGHFIQVNWFFHLALHCINVAFYHDSYADSWSSHSFNSTVSKLTELTLVIIIK